MRKGDRVTVSVQARYDQSNTGTTLGNTSFLTAVVSAFTGVSTFEGQTITAALSAPEVFSSFELLSDAGEGVPFAHLNFMLFDENFVYQDGGAQRVSTTAATQHETLTLDITIPQRGYLFVYVSNESEWDVRTYFDELVIDHEHLDVIQHDDYYPFGLAHNQNAQQERSNKYLYQGKERQFELGLGWDDFHARQYDAALGRWHVMDPAGQFASPYTAMGNNPVNYVDPDGKLAWFVPIIVGAAISGAGYTANVAFSDGGFDNWNWGQFGLSVGIGAVSGAASYGIGSAFGPVGSSGFVGELARAATHGHVNMMIGSIFGQDPSFAAFASGALGSLTGSALHTAHPLVQIGGSTLTGGVSAELSGGDFWRGAATGAIVTGLNHVLHKVMSDPGKWETTGEYEKSGRLVGIHRVVKQRNGYTTYAAKNGRWFTLDPNGEVVRLNMFDYFPGGETFANSKPGQVGKIIINRGLELFFLFRNMPWFINDPVVPNDYIDSQRVH